MRDIPIHPMLVHFPIVLAVVLPLIVGAVLLATYEIDKGRKYWAAVIVTSFLLCASGFLAIQTGEASEDQVEKVLVSERPLENHEETAETFFKVSLAALVFAGIGLLGNNVGLVSRYIVLGVGLVTLFMSFQVGHSGGSLVYQHGAASAFARGNTQNENLDLLKKMDNPSGMLEQEEKEGSDDDD